jgi:hypothetical protein
MGQLTFQATLGGAINLAGPNIATTTTFTLPSADGTNGQFLKTNGSGTLSFASVASSQWTTTGSDIYYNTGLVGIGAIPVNARKLTVSSAGQSDLSVVAGSSDYGQLLFGYVGADNKGIVAYNNADNSMQFYTNGTERARFNSTGALVLAGGTTSANGIGITFPATQSASSNANTLDDYEEGTWTPNQGPDVTVVGTFSSSGTYTKIGRVVTIIATITSSGTVAATALGKICSNLPFSSVAGGSAYGTGTAYNNTAATTSVTQAVGTDIYVFSAFAATTAIQFTNTYTTST